MIAEVRTMGEGLKPIWRDSMVYFEGSDPFNLQKAAYIAKIGDFLGLVVANKGDITTFSIPFNPSENISSFFRESGTMRENLFRRHITRTLPDVLAYINALRIHSAKKKRTLEDIKNMLGFESDSAKIELSLKGITNKYKLSEAARGLTTVFTISTSQAKDHYISRSMRGPYSPAIQQTIQGFRGSKNSGQAPIDFTAMIGPASISQVYNSVRSINARISH